MMPPFTTTTTRATTTRATMPPATTTTTTTTRSPPPPSAHRTRRAALKHIALLTASVSPMLALGGDARAAKQPIDWLFTSSFDADADLDLGRMIKDAAAGKEYEPVPRDAAKSAKSDDDDEEEKTPVDVTGTATKFGKLGVILVVADVITAAVMGKSVLGVAKSLEVDASERFEVGDDGVAREKPREAGAPPRDWKEKIADDLLKKFKENNPGAVKSDAEGAEGEE